MNPLAPVREHAVGPRARSLARRLDASAPAQDPAVALAERLRAVGAAAAVDVDPGGRFRSELRTRLLAVAAVQAAAPETAPTTLAPTTLAAVSWRTSSRVGGVLAGALACVVLVGGAAVAGSQSLPGDPFYGVKRTQEALQLRFARTDEARGVRHLTQASTRLGELQQLVQVGAMTGAGAPRPGGGLAAGSALGAPVAQRVSDTLIDMDDDTLRGQALLTAAFGDNDDRLRMLSRWATEQSEGLELLVPSLPDSTRDRARRSLSVVVAVGTDTGRLLQGPAPCSPPCAPAAASPGATPHHGGQPGEPVRPATPGSTGAPRSSDEPAAPATPPMPITPPRPPAPPADRTAPAPGPVDEPGPVSVPRHPPARQPQPTPVLNPAPAPTPAPTPEPDPEPQDLPSPGPLLPSPGSHLTPLPQSPGQPGARTGHRVVLRAPTTAVPALQRAGAH